MNKRNFLKTAFSTLVLSFLQPFSLFANSKNNKENITEIDILAETQHSQEFNLPALPYKYDELEPYFDKLTMEIHHSKHHASYVKNLNEGVKNTPFAKMELAEILAKVTDKFPVIRNNAGGHYNHSFFWQILSPNTGQQPTSDFLKLLEISFGSFEKFKEKFAEAGKNRFGSGWAWLIVDNKGKLSITSTPNQDNPLMSKINKEKGTPLLALDVWEHAYYLKYQNKRADYIQAFWQLVNWKEVQARWKK
jgi:superoxide dismutase, Fe-Mn family